MSSVTISIVAIAGAASFPREHCHDDRHLTVAVAVAGALDGERFSGRYS